MFFYQSILGIYLNLLKMQCIIHESNFCHFILARWMPTANYLVWFGLINWSMLFFSNDLPHAMPFKCHLHTHRICSVNQKSHYVKYVFISHMILHLASTCLQKKLFNSLKTIRTNVKVADERIGEKRAKRWRLCDAVQQACYRSECWCKYTVSCFCFLLFVADGYTHTHKKWWSMKS